jgi:hypothetical protein
LEALQLAWPLLRAAQAAETGYTERVIPPSMRMFWPVM